MAEPINLNEYKAKAPNLKTGGGDGTSDDMEARVTKLERQFEAIDGKLNSISTDLAYIKGKFESAPTAKDFGELKGRVDSLPTTAKLATVVGIIGAIITIISKFQDIRVWFGF